MQRNSGKLLVGTHSVSNINSLANGKKTANLKTIETIVTQHNLDIATLSIYITKHCWCNNKSYRLRVFKTLDNHN